MRRKCAGGRRVEGPTVVFRPDPPYSYMTRQLTLPWDGASRLPPAFNSGLQGGFWRQTVRIALHCDITSSTSLFPSPVTSSCSIMDPGRGDLVSLASSLSSALVSDSSILAVLLSLAFLLGVWVRDTTAPPAGVRHKLSLAARADRAHHRQIKRKLYLNLSDGGEDVTTERPPSERLLVTRPERVYSLEDLVPPSFFVSDDSVDYFEDPQPLTYQSFLVRKLNLKPPNYGMESQHSPVRYEKSWRSEQHNVKEDEGTWWGSTDWVRHWIDWLLTTAHTAIYQSKLYRVPLEIYIHSKLLLKNSVSVNMILKCKEWLALVIHNMSIRNFDYRK